MPSSRSSATSNAPRTAPRSTPTSSSAPSIAHGPSGIAATPSRRCATTPPDAYRTETGSTWRPRRGSHVSQTRKITAAAIDARDFLRAREHRANEAHLPDGTLVAVAGGKEAGDVNAICNALDRVKERHPDMVLLHGGGPGAERIAARWADNHAVHQVVFRPDWNAHGRAAPFRRNDQLLKLLPTGLVAFPGGGISENLVDKARELGIPVARFDA